ncbi:MAG: hypothetical protein MMC33_007259 [Icmadophila ericetorum]|nr:hypothetical protein [Icmadophila ericetorum]
MNHLPGVYSGPDTAPDHPPTATNRQMRSAPTMSGVLRELLVNPYSRHHLQALLKLGVPQVIILSFSARVQPQDAALLRGTGADASIVLQQLETLEFLEKIEGEPNAYKMYSRELFEELCSPAILQWLDAK